MVESKKNGIEFSYLTFNTFEGKKGILFFQFLKAVELYSEGIDK